jgi:DNA-binding MarR family transcriptional regulator
MSPTLREEIRQQKPFWSLAQEAFLSIARTDAVLRESLDRVFKQHGLSGTQYNVLRILRGADPDGLCRNEIRGRLVTRMPDVTRLLDRMEEAGLIRRARDGEDRREVSTRLTARGRELADALVAPVQAEHQRRLGHLSEEQLRTLVELLALARQGE